LGKTVAALESDWQHVSADLPFHFTILDDNIDLARERLERARTAVDLRRTEIDRRFIELALAALDAVDGNWEPLEGELEAGPVYTREARDLYEWLTAKREKPDGTLASHLASVRAALS